MVELLVVIAVIGILAGIAFVVLGGIRMRTRNAQRKIHIRTIQTAMEIFYDVNEMYPLAYSLVDVADDLNYTYTLSLQIRWA